MEIIKTFTKDCLEGCANIYPNIFNKKPWNEKWTAITAYKRLEDIYNTPNFMGIVCLKDENIVGAILGNIENWDNGLKYILKEFFVDSYFQGVGIGSIMIKFIENELEHINVKSVELYTLKGKNVEIFYKNNKYNNIEDLTIMNKVL